MVEHYPYERSPPHPEAILLVGEVEVNEGGGNNMGKPVIFFIKDMKGSNFDFDILHEK